MKKLIIASLLLLLPACSYVSYEAKTDGSTIISGAEIGTTTALSGANFERLPDGTRRVSIDSLSRDQVEGMKQINQGLSLIIEGAVKGAK